jgi:large subunit ribosomal protein L25
MEKLILKATMREDAGKSACKHLRKVGQIPAIVYKGGKEGLKVHVDTKALWHVMHTEAGENAIITMDISGGDKNLEKTVIVSEIQADPVNDKFLHVDFHEISLKEKLKVSVPLVMKGEAVGVKEEEGILTQLEWEIEVECLPTAIPENLSVNVEELHVGDAIHVSDITAPEGVVIIDDPEKTVVSVHLPKAEVEEAAPEEEGEGEGEPEVIKKGKKEEEGEGEPASSEGEE